MPGKVSRKPRPPTSSGPNTGFTGMPSGVSQGTVAELATGVAAPSASSSTEKSGILVIVKPQAWSFLPSADSEFRHANSLFRIRPDKGLRVVWSSFHLQTEPLNQITKLDIVLVQELRQFLRAARYGVEPAHGERLLELRIGDDLGDVGIELLDDGCRRAARDKHGEPEAHVHARQSGFRESRHV